MMDMNHGAVIGRIATEPKYTQDKFSKLDFSLVFNTTKKNGDKYEDEGNFLNLTVWGKLADTMSRYLEKGKQVCISYHLHVDTWEKDGKKQYALKTVVENIQLLGSTKKSSNQEQDAVSEELGW